MAVENDSTGRTSASKPAQAIGESAGRDAANAKESGTQQSASSIATVTAAEDEEDMEAKVERALACPCVADLRDGPCGEPFKEAFRCFMLSTDPVKGTDCIESFQALQACIAQHPEEFLEFLESGEGIDLAAAEKHAEDTKPAAAQQLQKQ